MPAFFLCPRGACNNSLWAEAFARRGTFLCAPLLPWGKGCALRSPCLVPHGEWALWQCCYRILTNLLVNIGKKKESVAEESDGQVEVKEQIDFFYKFAELLGTRVFITQYRDFVPYERVV